MKIATRLLLGLAVVALAGGVTLAEGEVTMEGKFVWARSDQDIDGDLKAIFKPAGKGQWTVDFHFDWEDGPHVYSGTAEGDLKSGSLKGEVQTDGDNPGTFRFSGDFEGATFKGKHGAVRDGELNEMGTLSLKRAS